LPWPRTCRSRPLYLLPDERGINAFAAGITPADAVVAVTRGTLLQLRRDELQGVIGHEFSHILNGDMRLGIRLAALLKGITFIGDVGHFLLRAGAYGVGRSHRQSSERSAALPILGLGLLVIGWLGSLSAGFIKAAISRQKEFLADASAVQFTRDNRGIANALKVIGGFLPGSLVHAARAAEMSHIFFGEVRHSLWEGFSTHPPLERRILRLDPQWDGEFIQRKERRYGLAPLSENQAQAGVSREALVMAAAASLAVADDEAPTRRPATRISPTRTGRCGADDAATAARPRAQRGDPRARWAPRHWPWRCSSSASRGSRKGCWSWSSARVYADRPRQARQLAADRAQARCTRVSVSRCWPPPCRR
jgi:hypothetical protein